MRTMRAPRRSYLAPKANPTCSRCGNTNVSALLTKRIKRDGGPDAVAEVHGFACGHARMRIVGQVMTDAEIDAIAARLGLYDAVAEWRSA